MPWQFLPSMVIIGGAFNAAAGLMYGAQLLTGEVCVGMMRVSYIIIMKYYCIGCIYMEDAGFRRILLLFLHRWIVLWCYCTRKRESKTKREKSQP